MDGLCHQCEAQLSPPWKFCPQCGTPIAPVTHQHASPQPHETEKAPVQNVFAGLYFGVIAAPIMIIVGTMLCLTGLGAILGIPMIIGGALAPLAGPMLGFGALKGKCPWCGNPVSSLPSAQSFDCDACKQRIAIRNHGFAKVA